MPDIYDQHDKAFEQVSAYVISQEGKKIGTIAFKFPRDGAGRLYCYLHVLGTQMARGAASGGGYDKRTAAAFDAAHKIAAHKIPPFHDGVRAHMARIAVHQVENEIVAKIKAAIKDAGHDWQHDLEAAGFTVWQAV